MREDRHSDIADPWFAAEAEDFRIQKRGVLGRALTGILVFGLGYGFWTWVFAPAPVSDIDAMAPILGYAGSGAEDPPAIGWAASVSEAANFSGDAVPLPPPQPGDWLYHFPEAGQTFEQFRGQLRNRRDNRRYVIYVVPLGVLRPQSERTVDIVAEYLDAYYDSPTKVLPRMAIPNVAWDAKRRQYDARRVLPALQRALPDDALGMVAVTEVDLYIPSVNYVFGLGSFERKVSVMSLYRFGSDFRTQAEPGTVLRRSLTVASHEFGHVLSMRHCTEFRCLMNGTNSLADADRHPQHLCPVCARKAQHAVHFHRQDRYARLQYFYEKYGMPVEQDFVERRLDPPEVELVGVQEAHAH